MGRGGWVFSGPDPAAACLRATAGERPDPRVCCGPTGVRDAFRRPPPSGSRPGTGGRGFQSSGRRVAPMKRGWVKWYFVLDFITLMIHIHNGFGMIKYYN